MGCIKLAPWSYSTLVVRYLQAELLDEWDAQPNSSYALCTEKAPEQKEER